MTWWTPRPTILRNFIALRQPTPEISLTKDPADTHTHKQTVNDVSTACLSACVDNKQTVNDISTTCLSACVDNKYASCPDWRNPHMPIADHRETHIVYNTDRHRPCGGLFLTAHTVRDGRASLWHRANERRTCHRFFNFWPYGTYPWAKGHQKGRWPTIRLDLPSYKNSARLRKRSTKSASGLGFRSRRLVSCPRTKSWRRRWYLFLH